MKIYENGKYRELTPSEIAEMEAANAQAELEYWKNVDYEDAVVAEIRKKYNINQELAIQRQRDEKLEEYMTYYAYCEQCKEYVKTKKAQFEKES